MNFLELISPMTPKEFIEKSSMNESFYIKGHENKFDNLITLDEIEKTLNNGCNINAPIQIIKDGGRAEFIQKNTKWSKLAIKKTIVKKLLEEKHSFLMCNQSQINPSVAKLIDTIEATFNNAAADLHLYISPKTSSTGYLAHRDRPAHKIYMQVIGKTNWKVYNHNNNLPDEVPAIEEKDEEQYLTKKIDVTLNPGDLLYMPPDTFHKVRNEDGPRVSFSIPFIIFNEKIEKMDRTYIPFKDIFESNFK